MNGDSEARTSNVVSRLRSERVCNTLGHKMLMHEAADEIERLRRERDEAQKLAQFECKARFDYYAYSDRLRAALDNLVGAVGALSDPEDQLSCIPAGPEAEELWQAWKDGEAALSGEQPPSETKPEPDVGALNRQLCEAEGHVFSRFAMHHCLRCEAAVTPGGYLAYTSSQKASPKSP